MPPLAPGFDARLDQFLSYLGEELPRSDQREKFALYTLGLLSDAERKSIEPIATQAEPASPEAAHQALLHFVANSPWNDRAVRRRALAWGLWGLSAAAPVNTTILDDTGILKQGKASVGVQRQYTGSAGKITNCQVAVTLCVSNGHDTLPVDIALYLPQSWADDPERRLKVRVPERVEFQTKGQIAREMLRQAAADGVPLGDLLLADADYGRDPETRALAGELGMNYAVGIHRSQRIWDARGVWTAPMTVAELCGYLSGRSFKRLSWRDDTQGRRLSARFAFRRVYLADGSREPERGRDRPVWLIMEWRDGEAAPGRFYVSDLPRRWTRKALVRALKERWRTERMYEDLKGEVGFDHYEGRSWPGWNHHMSVVLSAYALLVAERCMAFPPGAPGDPSVDPHGGKARPPRRRFAAVVATRLCRCGPRSVVAPMPHLRPRTGAPERAAGTGRTRTANLTQ
ncbi:MAG: IS701 family transposase [Polyangiales bacterium]